MAASYPTSVKTFTTKLTNDVIAPSHPNELQDEITAIETDLLAGLPVARGGTGNTTAATSGQLLVSDGTKFVPTTGVLGTPAEQTTTATGAQNNFDLTTRYTYLRCTGAAPAFSGFTVAGAAPQGGDTVIIACLGTTAKVDTQGSGSTDVNRAICPSTQGQIVGVNGTITLVYDTTTDRWRMVDVEPGTPVAYTPTWAGSGSNPAIGDGTLAGTYVQRGKRCEFTITLVAGGTTTFGTGTYTWALPLTGADADQIRVTGLIRDTGTGIHFASSTDVIANTTTTVVALQVSAAMVTNTAPMTWANTDRLHVGGEYTVA